MLGTPAYWESTIPDINGNDRRGYIFNLEPIDAETELLPAYGGEELTSPAVADWTPPNFSDVVVEGGELPAESAVTASLNTSERWRIPMQSCGTLPRFRTCHRRPRCGQL